MKPAARLARVNEVPLFKTAKLRCLSRWGIQFLIKQCEFISEGQTVRENGTTSFFGSSMITLEAKSKRGEISGKNLDEIITHIKNNPVINIHFSRMARLEATRRIGTATLGTAYYTFSAKRNGKNIEITIDLEIPNIEHGTRVSGV